MDVVPRIGDEKEVGFRSVRSFSAVCNATEFARLFVKRKADCKPTAMPYAVVMATGGTASVAAAANYWLLAATLLTLACLQAVYIPLAWFWLRRRFLSMPQIPHFAGRSAEQYVGAHTIPLGLAVVSSGMAFFAHVEGMTALLGLAEFLLALSWLLVLLCAAPFFLAVYRFGISLERVSGAWFLVPAAILGAGVATGDVLASTQSDWNLVVVAGALLGGILYVAIAFLAALRIRRFRLHGVPQAPWWIAMGCAGFAALALGHAWAWQDLTPVAHHALAMLMLLAEILAIVLFFPIAFRSAIFLFRDCAFRNPVAWPPTFSTSVFALSCLQSASILSIPAFHCLGIVAGSFALLFWFASIFWELWRRVTAGYFAKEIR